MHKKPFIIAEISGNHKQSLKRALKLIDAAADAGADAIKLQTFTPEGMTLNIKKMNFYSKTKILQEHGETKHFLRSLKKPKHLGNGIKKYFIEQKKRD